MAQRRGLSLLAQAANQALAQRHGECSWRSLNSLARPAVAPVLETHKQPFTKRFSAGSQAVRGEEHRGSRFWEWLLLIPGITTFGLGTWQLQRKEEKEKLLELRRRQLEQDPIPLAKALAVASTEDKGNLSTIDSLEYKRVVCSGTYDESRSLFLGPRVRAVFGVSEKGYYVITPFTPSNSSEPAVLVNRGWVPSSWREERDAPASDEAKPSPEEQEEAVSPSGGEGLHELSVASNEEPEQLKPALQIVGVIRGNEHPSSFVPSNAPAFAQWFYVDVPAMAAACGLPEDTLLVDLVRNESEAPAGPMKFPLPKDPRDLVHARVMPQDHLNYALTWYTLSGATTFMAWKRLQPKRKSRR